MASIFTCWQGLCTLSYFLPLNEVFITLATFICYLCLHPPFCALQLPVAVDMAKDSHGRDHELKNRLQADELKNRLQADHYMFCAVRECYESCKNIINFLVLGERERV